MRGVGYVQSQIPAAIVRQRSAAIVTNEQLALALEAGQIGALLVTQIVEVQVRVVPGQVQRVLPASARLIVKFRPRSVPPAVRAARRGARVDIGHQHLGLERDPGAQTPVQIHRVQVGIATQSGVERCRAQVSEAEAFVLMAPPAGQEPPPLGLQ